MQHRVCGPAQGDHRGDGVFERFLAQDVRRRNASLQKPHHGLPGPQAVSPLGVGDGFLGGTVGEAHAERFNRRGHGVGGVHPCARSRARYGSGLDLPQFSLAHPSGSHAANRLKDGNHIAMLWPGLDRAAVNEYRRPVESCQSHDATRHVLVAPADRDQPVKPFRGRHGLDGIGDDFPRNQRVAHPLGAHGNPVGYRNRIEDDALAAGLVCARTGQFRQPADMHVAGRHHAPGGGNADLRFGEVFILETDRAQHGPARSLLQAVNDHARMPPGINFAAFARRSCCHACLPASVYRDQGPLTPS